jgi:putative N6-adenine-specific DNA methylase
MYELIATTTFGIEAICKRELEALGFQVISTENGKVTFLGDERGIVKANLWLRTADRVLLKVDEFKAFNFDQLFDQIKKIPWGKYIPKNGQIIVNAKSVKSKLYSLRDIQSLSKKAIVDKLLWTYKTHELRENGKIHNVLVSILKDKVTVTLDTTGPGLHKRGYRIKTVEAPLKETLGAALVLLSYYNKDRVLYDVFCGSGTIPIEAAMIARNIAPGLNRDFESKHFDFIPKELWKEETKKAYQEIDFDSEVTIFASDISEDNLACAIENAEEAGVDDCITFTHSDFRDLEIVDDYSIVISNPPYGERLSDDDEVKILYRDLGKKIGVKKTWSKYFLTSFSDFERAYDFNADRKRKLYNGKLETWYYQYYGPKPPLSDE